MWQALGAQLWLILQMVAYSPEFPFALFPNAFTSTILRQCPTNTRTQPATRYFVQDQYLTRPNLILKNLTCWALDTLKTLPKAQRTRGLSSSFQSNLLGHITSSNTNLVQTSSSKSRPSIHFKIHTKHHHLD